MAEGKVFIIDIREMERAGPSATEENTAGGGTPENSERGRSRVGEGHSHDSDGEEE